jgi:23S rRNA (cytosine1962-C5)-methyltransferase
MPELRAGRQWTGVPRPRSRFPARHERGTGPPNLVSSIPVVHLRAGHVQPIWAGHPWVYAQAIERVEGGKPAVGDVVRVIDPHGNLMGRGFWSPRQAIPVRIVTRDDATSLDDPRWLVDRITRALARRRAVGLPAVEPSRRTNGYRLLHAEGDEVPGLVVDLFGTDDAGRGGVAVVQVGTAGLRARAQSILAALDETVAPRAVIDRTSISVAKAEGFTLDEAFVRGEIESLVFEERGLRFEIPRDLGQKTGFYFDQRPLRAAIESLARGRRVLDAYSYVGPIAISAARGGAASVAAIDDSLRAIEVGAACAKSNSLEVSFTRGDVRKELPKLAASGVRFDLVVLDPPKLAPTRGDRDAAARYQTKLVETASTVVEPGGLLVVCSCSTALGSSELARSLAIGARRAGRTAIVLDRLGQGGDHPVPAAFPEGLYLSTIVAELG